MSKAVKLSSLAIAIAAASLSAQAASQSSLEERIAKLEKQLAEKKYADEKSEFKIYGAFRPTLAYIDTKDANSQTDIKDGASHLGFTGSYEIAPELKAIYKAEWWLRLDDDATIGNARFVYGGLEGKLGTIKIGKMRQPHSLLIASPVDIYHNIESPFGYDKETPYFMDNLVSYQYDLNNFTLMAAAQFNGKDEIENHTDTLNLGGRYKNDRFSVALSWASSERLKRNDGSDSDKKVAAEEDIIAIAGSVNILSNLYAGLAYQDKSTTFHATNLDASGYSLDAVLSYDINKSHTIKGGYFANEEEFDKSDEKIMDYSGFNVTYLYKLADNVSVHLEYLTKDYDNNIGGTDEDAVAVGFSYGFSKSF
ncbi:porin [Algicola sagamiensis]|uniref:porin n=1 Tax=Algicola sagamiensis TaxID=163869 RepID=UPI00035D7162|nr:porin [Algicola sagamiensis]